MKLYPKKSDEEKLEEVKFGLTDKDKLQLIHNPLFEVVLDKTYNNPLFEWDNEALKVNDEHKTWDLEASLINKVWR